MTNDFVDRTARDPVPTEDRAADIPGSHAELAAFDAEVDLEAAYRRALAAVEAAEQQFDLALADLSDDPAGDDQPSEAVAGGYAANDPDASATPASSKDDPSSDALQSGIAPVEHSVEDESERRLQPRRIIEAALFVGGSPLTTRKLRGLLRDEFDADFIEGSIERLNAEYREQNRPYEVRFGEGGFRLELREAHERLRNRVFGHAPREVRLSQEVLEVLALVAYRQPVGREEIEAICGKDPSGTLRQLVRRELVAIERDDDSPAHVLYRTTPRFLEVFGLASIDELPRAEDLEFK